MSEHETHQDDEGASASKQHNATKEAPAKVQVQAWITDTTPGMSPHSGLSSMLSRPEPDDEAVWSIPWANLMMVLFVIVFMLVSLQSKNLQEQEADQGLESSTKFVKTVRPIVKTPPPTIQPGTSEINRGEKATSTQSNRHRLTIQNLQDTLTLSRLRSALQAIDNGKITLAQHTDMSVRVSLPSDWLFDDDGIQLSANGIEVLGILAQALTADHQISIAVVGHTDDQIPRNTRYADNWELSTARARAVARHLIEVDELEAALFTVSGRAQYEPLTSNLIASSRAQNRRIELIFRNDNNNTRENTP